MKITKGNPCMMGVVKTNDGYNFSIQSEEDNVDLLLYQFDGRRPEKIIRLDTSFKIGEVFSVCLSDCNLHTMEYNYSINGAVFVDPYAKTISGCDKFGIEKDRKSFRSRVELGEFDWGGDTPLNIPYDESVVYKLHVRGFTKSRTSGVSLNNRGTFAGIIEKIPYLKELGVTTLELMPCYEFEEVDRFEFQNKSIYTPGTKNKLNYWGYTGGLHFAPKASFSAAVQQMALNEVNGSYGDYSLECKRMIKELHRNGIEVVMEMFFTEADSSNLIDDCVRYWVMEYHIDGVHLYCDENSLAVVVKDPLLANTKLFTVYWGSGYQGKFKKMGNYNDHFATIAKCFLKGDENQLTAFAGVLRDNPPQSAMINYITNHNGFTLNDLVSYDRKHNEVNGEDNRDGENFNHSWNCGFEGKTKKKKINELRLRQMKNAFTLVLLGQGTPLIVAGDEFNNSQEGNNNPYCVDSELSWINWKNTKDAQELTAYVKDLIRFRKHHKIIHMPKQLHMSDTVSCGFPDISYHGDSAWYTAFENYNRHIGIMYCSKYADKKDLSLIYIAYNMHWETHRLALPTVAKQYKWEICLYTTKGKQEIIIDNNRSVLVPPRSIAVLTGICVEAKNGKLLHKGKS